MSRDDLRLSTDILFMLGRSIERRIGYPSQNPNIRSPSDLQNHYGDVNIYESTYFPNTISITQSRVRKMWQKLGHPSTENVWPLMVTSTDIQAKNLLTSGTGPQVTLPYGLLRCSRHSGLSCWGYANAYVPHP